MRTSPGRGHHYKPARRRRAHPWANARAGKGAYGGDGPHILAGGLNALDGTDYSADRWADIVKVPS